MERKGRFKDFIWNKFRTDDFITLIGLGGIGSYTFHFLTRIDNFKFRIFDMDHYSELNLGGQLADYKSINSSKVETAVRLAKSFSKPENKIEAYTEPFNEDCPITPITFVLPDNMKVRKIAFNLWKELDNKQLFVEARLLGENMEIFMVQPGMEEQYEAYLFDDKDVEEAPCTMKGTSHSAGIIGGLITSWFNNWCSNQVLKDDEMYLVPFHTSFNLAEPFSYSII